MRWPVNSNEVITIPSSVMVSFFRQIYCWMSKGGLCYRGNIRQNDMGHFIFVLTQLTSGGGVRGGECYLII